MTGAKNLSTRNCAKDKYETSIAYTKPAKNFQWYLPVHDAGNMVRPLQYQENHERFAACSCCSLKGCDSWLQTLCVGSLISWSSTTHFEAKKSRAAFVHKHCLRQRPGKYKTAPIWTTKFFSLIAKLTIEKLWNNKFWFV